MALTKKMANHIADLINECTVARIMSDSAEKEPSSLERIEKIRRWRDHHDKAARALNEILGQRAVVPYHQES